MKQYGKDFIKIGLMTSGGGPLVLAIIYIGLEAAGIIDTLTVREVVLGICSSLLLAFIAGGIQVVYRIERLPLMWATLIHAFVLYLDYILIYLANGWIVCEAKTLLIFTGIFLAGYILIWTLVYVSIRRKVKMLNTKIRA